MKIVISKCLGFGIIAGSVLVKLPQIAKIIIGNSGEGINVRGVTLELVAALSSLAYSAAKGFPFSAYGEGLFLTVQTWAIGFLVIFYRGHFMLSFAYTTTFLAALVFLLSPLAPISLLWGLQACVVPNIFLGRVSHSISHSVSL
ncbi:Mannose-P-dolichol utilization defect 1 protein [Lamellibrachia satsuma]|nr:Mannose-P-dolichol utilization defect 1 protein [Lamellibrachia satsuma]